MITEEEKHSTQQTTGSESHNTPDASEWLKERKQELDRLFEEKAREMSKRAQTSIASRMQNYESALRSASGDLHENDEARFASIADAAADRIKSSAQYLENTDPKELADDGAQIVRRTPYLALGASLLFGLAVGKLARTASRESADATTES